MGLEVINSNLEQARKIIGELALLNHESETTNLPEEAEFFKLAMQAMLRQLEMVNNSIPSLVNGISLAKQILPASSVEIHAPSGMIILNKEYRKKFFDELKISEEAMRKLRKKK